MDERDLQVVLGHICAHDGGVNGVMATGERISGVQSAQGQVGLPVYFLVLESGRTSGTCTMHDSKW